jgi:hypothetical protein
VRPDTGSHVGEEPKVTIDTRVDEDDDELAILSEADAAVAFAHIARLQKQAGVALRCVDRLAAAISCRCARRGPR